MMADQTKRMLEKVQSTGDLDYLGTVALNLQSFYTAVERIFIAIAKEIDTTIPKQENWHQVLLEQMAVEIPKTRQAYWRLKLIKGWMSFVGFGTLYVVTTLINSILTKYKIWPGS